MRDIYVISDTHFNQARILEFENSKGEKTRPEFSNVQEMNERMIENWNRVVKPGDIVYHLGDVYFGDAMQADKILSRLNGRKRLIVGNHDDVKDKGILIKHFQKISMWRMFKEHKVVLTHTPIYLGADETRKYDFNIHGHIHRNRIQDDRYFNVSVEMINYTPQPLHKICEKFK